MYRVTWEIDIEADNAIDAARKARNIQCKRSSTATVFDIGTGKGTATRIDLTERTAKKLDRVIKIEVEGGCVTDVHNLPHGWQYEIDDKD